MSTAITTSSPSPNNVWPYTPALGANTYYICYFAVLLAAELYNALASKLRYHRYIIHQAPLLVGLAMEALGYVLRLQSRSRPTTLFYAGQSFFLVFAPMFISATMYIRFAGLVELLQSSQYCLIHKTYYIPIIFILADVVSAIFQCAAGAVVILYDDQRVVSKALSTCGSVIRLVSFAGFLALMLHYWYKLIVRQKVLSYSTRPAPSTHSTSRSIFAVTRLLRRYTNDTQDNNNNDNSSSSNTISNDNNDNNTVTIHRSSLVTRSIDSNDFSMDLDKCELLLSNDLPVWGNWLHAIICLVFAAILILVRSSFTFAVFYQGYSGYSMPLPSEESKMLIFDATMLAQACLAMATVNYARLFYRLADYSQRSFNTHLMY